MLSITSEITGKKSYYGYFKPIFEKNDIHMCGNWEYYEAYFDSTLYQKDGVSIYLRIPAEVVEGKLDDCDACVQFGEPFMIKHVMYMGLMKDDMDFSALDVIGLNQFQKPVDPDDHIEQQAKWRQVGERKIDSILKYIH
jgi:hypothetical protein